MGYTTEFEGTFVFLRPLTEEEASEINTFCTSRHGGPKEDPGCPSFWCDWETDGLSLSWNGSEKSYCMEEWARVLIERFFRPWGVLLSGRITAQGESRGDTWAMEADGHEIRHLRGHLEFVPEDGD